MNKLMNSPSVPSGFSVENNLFSPLFAVFHDNQGEESGFFATPKNGIFPSI